MAVKSTHQSNLLGAGQSSGAYCRGPGKKWQNLLSGGDDEFGEKKVDLREIPEVEQAV